MSIYLQQPGLVCSLGVGTAEVRAAMWDPACHPGVARTDQYSPGRELPLGVVDRPLHTVSSLPVRFQSRSNAMMLTALSQIRPAVAEAVAAYGSHRVAIVLGTSTAGLTEGEEAQQSWQAEGQWPAGYRYAQQELGNPAECLAHVLQLRGVRHVISTACSSGAKALASGARLLQAGLADAVIAGGVDVLGRFTVAGFSALESVSSQPCNPLSANRCGINLGEGAALFLMSREPAPVRLAGWGESSDAHHMSAPDPSGRGAAAAMTQALVRAGLSAAEVDYINLHGTATPQNDAMESAALAMLGLDGCAVSSTKPLTGHTLAAAGAIEAALCWISMVDNPDGTLPPHLWDGERDPALPVLQVARPGVPLGRPVRHALSNSFAFGGSNAALLFSVHSE